MPKDASQGLEDQIKRARDMLFDCADAVLVIAVTHPNHDDAIGRVMYSSRGKGPAYTTMMYALEDHFASNRVEDVHEIDPDDEE